MKTVKKTRQIWTTVMLIAVLAVTAFCLTRFSAFGEEDGGGVTHNVTIKLNGGSQYTAGISDEPGTFSDADIVAEVGAGALIFTHTVARELFGDKPVYQKMAIEPVEPEGEVTHEDFMPPTGDNAELTPLLDGLFIDADEDGILDANETFYRNGDTLNVATDMVLTCHYGNGMTYKMVGWMDKKYQVKLSKAWNGAPASGVTYYYTAQDIQPFLHEVFIIGGHSFDEGWPGARALKGIEIPETVGQIEEYAFKQEDLEYVKGLDNVSVFYGNAFADSFKFSYGPWDSDVKDLKFVLGPKLEVLGGGMFAFPGGPNTRVILTGWDTEKRSTSPLYGNHGKSVFSPLYEWGLHNDTGVTYPASKERPAIYVFVPYGTTADWYPDPDLDNTTITDDKNKTNQFTMMTMIKGADTGGADVPDYNVPMREMYTVKYDLDGGLSADGKASIADDYQDAGAVSVKNLLGDEKNLTSRDEANDNARLTSKNDPEQDLTLLSLTKPADPVRNGYVFIGWQQTVDSETVYMWQDSDWGKQGRALTADTALTAVWKDAVTVTFEPNNSQQSASVTLYEGALLTKPADPIPATHYAFDAWCSDQALSTEWDFETDTVGTAPVTLYARYTAAKYNIVYYANGGVMQQDGGVTIDDSVDDLYYGKYTYGAQDILPTATKNRYVFAGWCDNAGLTGVPFSVMPAGKYATQSLYAKWTPTFSTFNIVYHLNGGTNAPGNPASIDSDRPVNLLAPAKSGAIFCGWYGTTDFSGAQITTIAAGADADINVYAKWEQNTASAPAVKNIVYELDGGVNADANPVTYTEGTEVALEAPSKDGFEFKGWYFNAEFLGGAATKIDASQKGDVTLYAKWEQTPTKKGCGGAVTGSAAALPLSGLIGAAVLLCVKKKRGLNG
jgi:uncharacterized repeat protein (TIGR02543 family)